MSVLMCFRFDVSNETEEIIKQILKEYNLNDINERFEFFDELVLIPSKFEVTLNDEITIWRICELIKQAKYDEQICIKFE